MKMSRIYVEMTDEEYQEWIKFKEQKFYNPDILIESSILNYKVEDCFCPRTSNALRRGIVGYNIPRESILTIKDLIMHSEKELSKYRYLGPKGIKEIKVWLEAHNLKLRGM
jgi:DNA-directed RNA polymerase alpha subunit